MGSLIGKTLSDRYRVTKRIGEGAMSDVYLAEHRQHPGVKFALKVLKPHLAQQRDFGRRFRAEVAVLGQLDHPGIVRLHDGFEEDGAICMVLAFIDGESLADRIRAHGAMPPAVALPMFKSVLGALDYAHQHGVVHRDIKPSNILIDAAGRPHLCDFGIAKQVGQRGMTATGMTLGTPQYMSPEQIQAPQSIDHRSDLYSAGIVLYEMLTGAVPFDGDDTASDYVILQQHVQSTPPDPRQFNPQLDPKLVEILAKALRKEPGKRIQGGTEFRQAIERVEHGLPPFEPGEGAFELPPGDLAGVEAGSHRYAIYEHAAYGHAAVKIGLCWPALLFGPLWMASKRLYGRALLWTAGEVLLVVMSLMLYLPNRDNQTGPLALGLLVVAAVIWAMPVWLGNRWCEDDLVQRGYAALGETNADSSEAALGQVMDSRGRAGR